MWQLGHKEGWALKNWCLQSVGLEKTLESPLDYKEIKPVSLKGTQPWYSLEEPDAEAEAPVLCLPDAKSQLIGKDHDAGKDWRQEKKGLTEDKMVGWHHQFNGHEFEQTLGDSEGQGAWHAAVHGLSKSRTQHRDWIMSWKKGGSVKERRGRRRKDMTQGFPVIY